MNALIASGATHAGCWIGGRGDEIIQTVYYNVITLCQNLTYSNNL